MSDLRIIKKKVKTDFRLKTNKRIESTHDDESICFFFE